MLKMQNLDFIKTFENDIGLLHNPCLNFAQNLNPSVPSVEPMTLSFGHSLWVYNYQTR